MSERIYGFSASSKTNYINILSFTRTWRYTPKSDLFKFNLVARPSLVKDLTLTLSKRTLTSAFLPVCRQLHKLCFLFLLSDFVQVTCSSPLVDIYHSSTPILFYTKRDGISPCIFHIYDWIFLDEMLRKENETKTIFLTFWQKLWLHPLMPKQSILLWVVFDQIAHCLMTATVWNVRKSARKHICPYSLVLHLKSLLTFPSFDYFIQEIKRKVKSFNFYPFTIITFTLYLVISRKLSKVDHGGMKLI